MVRWTDKYDQERIKSANGENVRQCRKDKGYTQEDLAEACNFSAAFCAQVETGSRMMSLPTLVKVSEVLHTTPNILIYGKTKNERIAHIVSMLDDMSESEISYIEETVLLARSWLHKK